MEAGVDLLVSDSPLILTHFYGVKYDWMEREFNTSEVMLHHHHEFCKRLGYKVEHYIIPRKDKYNPSGRYQTEEEAVRFDAEIVSLLEEKRIKYMRLERNDISLCSQIISDLIGKRYICS